MWLVVQYVRIFELDIAGLTRVHCLVTAPYFSPVPTNGVFDKCTTNCALNREPVE